MNNSWTRPEDQARSWTQPSSFSPSSRELHQALLRLFPRLREAAGGHRHLCLTTPPLPGSHLLSSSLAFLMEGGTCLGAGKERAEEPLDLLSSRAQGEATCSPPAPHSGPGHHGSKATVP